MTLDAIRLQLVASGACASPVDVEPFGRLFCVRSHGHVGPCRPAACDSERGAA